ncbi:MAG: hypothetical protein V3S14_06470, partial [Anaerolineae bacterium]
RGQTQNTSLDRHSLGSWYDLSQNRLEVVAPTVSAQMGHSTSLWPRPCASRRQAAQPKRKWVVACFGIP